MTLIIKIIDMKWFGQSNIIEEVNSKMGTKEINSGDEKKLLQSSLTKRRSDEVDRLSRLQCFLFVCISMLFLFIHPSFMHYD